MPNRILREGILTSERVNALNWEAEVFYRRLMSVVDDFGRYTAHPSLLRAALFPLKLETVRDANMERLLALVEQAHLVRVYEVQGKRYLELLDFKQQVRAKDSKYPQPPIACAADATQAPITRAASAPVFGDGDVVEDEIPAAPSGAGLFDEFWAAYPKKKAKDDALKAFTKRKPDRALLASMLKAIEAQKRSEDWAKDGGKFIPYPATWLNDGRWQDEEQPQFLAASPANDDAERTRRMLDAQRMTPEEKAKADAVRRAVLSAIKPITREAA